VIEDLATMENVVAEEDEKRVEGDKATNKVKGIEECIAVIEDLATMENVVAEEDEKRVEGDKATNKVKGIEECIALKYVEEEGKHGDAIIVHFHYEGEKKVHMDDIIMFSYWKQE
jgi:hydrogenase maturation factor